MVSPQKSVLITGCSGGGIGPSLAEAFRQRGYYVYATARTPSKIPQKLRDAPNVETLTLDVLSQESIDGAVESVKKRGKGRLDVLVNNSGGTYVAPALDVPFDEGKKVFDLNVWAPLAVIKAFSPLLIESRGYIVNNTSACAVAPFGFMSMYNASKAALVSISETLRHELQPLGVRTMTLITLGVKTKVESDVQLNPALPRDSRYLHVQDFIRRLTPARIQAQSGAMDPDVYAAKVVREVERGSVGPVWAGKDATVSRLAMTMLPQSAFDMLVQSVVPVSAEMAKAAKKQ